MTACRFCAVIFAAAAEEPGAADIDVHGLFEGFRRIAVHGGVEILTAAEVLGLVRNADSWSVETTRGTYAGRVVVNAAGAWAGHVGNIGRSRRPRPDAVAAHGNYDRAARGIDVSSWLFVNDIAEEFYFKPESGLVLASPTDETPSEPCDAQPEEIDVATIAWRIEEATYHESEPHPSQMGGIEDLYAGPDPALRIRCGRRRGSSGSQGRVASAYRHHRPFRFTRRKTFSIIWNDT